MTPDSSSPLRFDRVQGEWWLPGKRPRSGALTVDGTRIQVRLHGQLERGDPLMPPPIYPIVRGRIENGQRITLRNVVVSALTMPLVGAGASHADLHPSEAFIGRRHLRKPADQLFAEAAITVPALLHAVRQTGLSRPAVWTFDYQRPPDLTSQLPNGDKVTTRTIAGTDSDNEVRISLREWGVFIVEPHRPITVRDYRDRFARPLERMVAFALDQTVEATQLDVRTKADRDWFSVVTGREQEKSIPLRAGVPPLLDLGRTNYAQLVPRWLELFERVRLSFDVFFAFAYRPGTELDRQVIESTQAVEAFDRIANPVPANDRTEHQLRLSAISAAIAVQPPATRNLVKRLRHAYEPALADRLRRQLAEEAVAIPLAAKQRNKLADRIARTRNALTHLDSVTRRPTITEMHEAAAICTTLFKLMVLRELGVPSAERRRAADRHQWPTPARMPTVI